MAVSSCQVVLCWFLVSGMAIIGIIGASLIEPHTSRSSYIYIYVCVCVFKGGNPNLELNTQSLTAVARQWGCTSVVVLYPYR